MLLYYGCVINTYLKKKFDKIIFLEIKVYNPGMRDTWYHILHEFYAPMVNTILRTLYFQFHGVYSFQKKRNSRDTELHKNT